MIIVKRLCLLSIAVFDFVLFFFYLFNFVRYNAYFPPPCFLHWDCILGISTSTQNILILFPLLPSGVGSVT